MVKLAKKMKIVKNFFLRTLNWGSLREMHLNKMGKLKKDQKKLNHFLLLRNFFERNAGLEKEVVR